MKDVEIKQVLELVKHPGFKAYTTVVEKSLKAYKELLYTEVDTENNNIKFSGHDMYRLMIRELTTLKEAPLKFLEGVYSLVQTDEGTTEAVSKTIELTKQSMEVSEKLA